MKTTTYTPQTANQVPFLSALFVMFADIFSSRKLIWVFFRRDFVTTYRTSFLGVFWSFVMPLVPMGAYVLMQVLGILRGSTSMPRLVYVVMGMSLWHVFAQSVKVCMGRIEKDGRLLLKSKIPIVVLYFSSLATVAYDFMVRLVIIYSVLIYTGIEFNFYWVLLPFMSLPFVLLGLSLGILGSYVAVFRKDIANLINIFLTYGMFASAVIFPLPKNLGGFEKLLDINILYTLVESTRELVVFGEFGALSSSYIFSIVLSILTLNMAAFFLYRAKYRVVGSI